MQWDLKIEKQIAFNVGYGADRAMRDIQAFEMFWHAEFDCRETDDKIIWHVDQRMRHDTSCAG